MPIIEANKISKCFRIYRRPSDHLRELFTFGRRKYHEPFWAVRDADVQVERGCCLGIIGENGSGKSTLLRMIAGVIKPTSGTISVAGGFRRCSSWAPVSILSSRAAKTFF
jgi:lipopolysaccharide transport system ATP-binding protein